MFAGKMGAGKSTKARQVCGEKNAVLIAEDEWLSSLFPGQITSFDDYLHFSSLLKSLVKSLVEDILKTGTNVVMDFPANTVNQRNWFKTLLSAASAPHLLIYLKVSDEVCLQHIMKRRTEEPERAGFDTEAIFYEVSQYFQAPDPGEGFNIEIVKQHA